MIFWKSLDTEERLLEITSKSYRAPILIFKHSTRCSISDTAKARMERQWINSQLEPFYLDILNFRPLSAKVAEISGIMHESPQAIVFYKGAVIYNASHLDINFSDIQNSISKHN